MLSYCCCGPCTLVPFVKWSFEWGIRGGANLTTFCYVLRVTWCHHVCFSCYFRQNGAAINVSNLGVSTSHPHAHIRRCSVEPTANSPKFTQNSQQIQACEFRTKFVRISYQFVLVCIVSSRTQLSSPYVFCFDHVANAASTGIPLVPARPLRRHPGGVPGPPGGPTWYGGGHVQLGGRGGGGDCGLRSIPLPHPPCHSH